MQTSETRAWIALLLRMRRMKTDEAGRNSKSGGERFVGGGGGAAT